LDTTSLYRSHTTTQWLHKGRFTIAQDIGNEKRHLIQVLTRHPDELSETPWIETTFLELGAHRDVPMPTVMTLQTGNMVRYYYSFTHLEPTHFAPDLDHFSGHLMTQDHWFCQRLEANFVNI